MSGNRFVIDTNVVIDLLKGSQVIADKIDHAQAILVPIPVLGELYYGAEKSQRRDYHRSQIHYFLQMATVVELTNRTAQEYSIIKAKLQIKGRPIPENDIWIAAIALQYQVPIVTQDHHFNEVENIKIVKWT